MVLTKFLFWISICFKWFDNKFDSSITDKIKRQVISNQFISITKKKKNQQHLHSRQV